MKTKEAIERLQAETKYLKEVLEAQWKARDFTVHWPLPKPMEAEWEPFDVLTVCVAAAVLSVGIGLGALLLFWGISFLR